MQLNKQICNIYLDFLPIIDKNDFINEYFNMIYTSINTPAEKIVKLFRNVFKTRPNITVAFSNTKESNFKLNFSHKEQKTTLYKSVKHTTIGEISKEEWNQYIKNGFKKHKKTILDQQVNTVLDTSKSFPYYTQQIAYELFNKTETKVTDEMISDTIKSILEKEEDLFLSDFSHLSQYQKKH